MKERRLEKLCSGLILGLLNRSGQCLQVRLKYLKLQYDSNIPVSRREFKWEGKIVDQCFSTFRI